MDNITEKFCAGNTQPYPDRNVGIAHLPLSETDRTDPKFFLRSFGGYVALAFGRWYQDRIREGGGVPNTSHPVLEAAVSHDPGKLAEAFLSGGEKRAQLQLAQWEQAGLQIPDHVRQRFQDVLSVAFVGLNITESLVLVYGGQEPYQQLIALEGQGGVADWAGGDNNNQGILKNSQLKMRKNHE